MKYLLIVLLLIVFYEVLDKKWAYKYFCRCVSKDINLIHSDKERIFYDNFSIFVNDDNSFTLVLDTIVVANWSCKDEKITSLNIFDEDLFNTFKRNYPTK